MRPLAHRKTPLHAALIALLAHCAPLLATTITTSGLAYTENFDSLGNATSSATYVHTPSDWTFAESTLNTSYVAGTGSSSTGDTYSFGSAGATDRAFGQLRGAGISTILGSKFANAVGASIRSLDIAYTGELWRLGLSSRSISDRMYFQYSLDADSLVTGSWTGVEMLDFVSPANFNAGAKDGNAAANRTALSATIGSLNIPDGATFWIRWTDSDVSGPDDGLAIDDFSLTATSAPSTPAAVPLPAALPAGLTLLSTMLLPHLRRRRPA